MTPTVREIAAHLGIPVGTAHACLKLDGAPDASRFKTLDSYARKLARHAIKHGQTHPALYAAAETPRKARPATATADTPVPAKVATPAPASAPAPEADELTRYEHAINTTLTTLTTLSQQIASCSTLTAQELPYLDRIDKLLKEARQAIPALNTLRRDRAHLLHRDDVILATTTLLITYRATLDTLITTLAEPTNLPAWLIDAGATLPPDTRALSATLRDHISAHVAHHANHLADHLADITAIPTNPTVTADLAHAIAAHLRQTANQLETDHPH